MVTLVVGCIYIAANRKLYTCLHVGKENFLLAVLSAAAIRAWKRKETGEKTLVVDCDDDDMLTPTKYPPLRCYSSLLATRRFGAGTFHFLLSWCGVSICHEERMLRVTGKP